MLIIGCGHPDCGDDAAGLLVARRLRELGLRAVEASGEATALMSCWEGETDVILVDATSSGAPPGTVQVWDAGQAPFARERFRCSTHGLGVAEAIELSRALGSLPPRLRIYGIEGRQFAPGGSQSPEVLEAVEQVVQRIREEVQCMKQD